MADLKVGYLSFIGWGIGMYILDVEIKIDLTQFESNSVHSNNSQFEANCKLKWQRPFFYLGKKWDNTQRTKHLYFYRGRASFTVISNTKSDIRGRRNLRVQKPTTFTFS